MIVLAAAPKPAPVIATLHVRKILFAFTHENSTVSAPWVVIQYGERDKAGNHIKSQQIRVRLTDKVRALLESPGALEDRVAALVHSLVNLKEAP